jgi:hypothetical protein
MKDQIYSLRISLEEIDAFVKAVESANHDVSTAHAVRELMHWYATGCGRLNLGIPLLFPKKDPAHKEPGDLHPE